MHWSHPQGVLMDWYVAVLLRRWVQHVKHPCECQNPRFPHREHYINDRFDSCHLLVV